MEFARNLACSVLVMVSICVGLLARSKISRAWAVGRSDLVGILTRVQVIEILMFLGRSAVSAYHSG